MVSQPSSISRSTTASMWSNTLLIKAICKSASTASISSGRKGTKMSSPATSPQSENTTPAPAVTDRSTKPQGVIPRNLQSWVWIALILVIGVGIFFSGGPKKPSTGSAATQPAGITPVSAGGLTPEQVSKRLQDSEEAARRNGLTPLQAGELPQPGDPRYNPDAAF